MQGYSLRQTLDRNIIQHAYDVNKREHLSYRLDQIVGAGVSNQTFSPRYEIELGSGPIKTLA